MSKQIVIYCGWDSKHEAAYTKMPGPYRNLTKEQKLTLLSELIDELTHEQKFICSQDSA
jgi:hypothetical protein